MRAVVIGGSGQIGGWLLRVLSERGHESIGTFATRPFPGLVHLDAADLPGASAWLRDQRPDIVFYPAGFTWVDQCERDPAQARSANVAQPVNLARASTDLGAKFVYFSTDYVFDGEAGPYDETAVAHPLGLRPGEARGGAALAMPIDVANHVGSSQGQGKLRLPAGRSLTGAPVTRPTDQFRPRATDPTPRGPCCWPRRVKPDCTTSRDPSFSTGSTREKLRGVARFEPV